MFYIIWIFSVLLILLSLTCIIAPRLSPITKMAILIIMYLLGGLLITYLDFYYLGLTYIIIYVGAIAVIFLFVIMMIEVQNTNNGKQQSFLFSYYSFIIFILSLSYFLIRFTYSIFLFFESNWFNFYISLTDIHLLSKILFNGYFLIIFFIGIILWTVLLGILS